MQQVRARVERVGGAGHRLDRHRVDPAVVRVVDLGGEHLHPPEHRVGGELDRRPVGGGEAVPHAPGDGLEPGVRGVEVEAAQRRSGPQVASGALNRDLAHGQAPVIRLDQPLPRHGRHEIAHRGVADAEVRMRADAERRGPVPHVPDPVRDVDPRRRQRVPDRDVEVERVAVLREHGGGHGDGRPGAIGHAVAGVPKQPVARVALRRLRDVELLRRAGERPAAVADAVRPRHEHDPGGTGGQRVRAVVLHDVRVADPHPAEARGQLGDDRRHRAVRSVEVQDVLRAGRGHLGLPQVRSPAFPAQSIIAASRGGHAER